MIRNPQLIVNYDFSGGINISKPPHLIQDDECFANLSTFDGTKNSRWSNGVVKRGGTEKVNAAAVGNKIVNGKRFYRSAAPAKTTICAIDGTDVRHYYLDGSSVFQEIVKGAPQIATGNDIHLTTWKDQLYSASGNQLLQVISYAGGWSIDDITGLAYKPQYICQHKDRLFAAGGDMPQGYLECTGYESDSSWSAGTGEAFNVGYKDGDPIRQLAGLKDNLIVYKQDSIWVLRGDNAQNWFQHRDEKAVGCYAPHSVADVIYGHIFLSIDNVYFFDGERLVPIGDNIKPWLDLIPIAYRKNACGAYYDGWYRLSFTNGTYNNKELLFDVNRFIATGRTAWWLNDGRNINNYIIYDGPDDDNTIHMCDSNAGHLRKMDTGTQDDTVDVENQFYSKHYGMGNPNIEKMFDRLKVDLSMSVGTVYLTLIKGLGIEAQLEIEFGIDTGSATNLWGTGVWGVCKWQSSDLTRFTHEVAIPAKMDGTTLAFILKHKTSQANVKFFGASLVWAAKSF